MKKRLTRTWLAGLLGLIVLAPLGARATDRYWTNDVDSVSQNWSVDGNWFAGKPVNGDSVYFDTTYIDPESRMLMNQDIAGLVLNGLYCYGGVGAGGSDGPNVNLGGDLLVTNEVRIGTPSQSGRLLWGTAGGSLLVTNSAGTASLVLDNGMYSIYNCPATVVDYLVATGGPNSYLKFQRSDFDGQKSLRILHGSTLRLGTQADFLFSTYHDNLVVSLEGGVHVWEWDAGEGLGIAYDDKGEAELHVSGAGTVWTNKNYVHLGVANDPLPLDERMPAGRITIDGGARGVIEDELTVAHSFGTESAAIAYSRVLVDGSDSSLMVYSNIYVGYEGTNAEMVVTNGGQIQCLSDVIVGYDPASSLDRLTVASASTLAVTNAAGDGTLEVRRGTVNLLPASTTLVDNVALQADAVLNLTITGAGPDGIGRIVMSGGTAALGGTLNVDTNGYSIQAGDRWSVISGGSSRSGTFAVENLPPGVQVFYTGGGFDVALPRTGTSITIL